MSAALAVCLKAQILCGDDCAKLQRVSTLRMDDAAPEVLLRSSTAEQFQLVAKASRSCLQRNSSRM